MLLHWLRRLQNSVRTVRNSPRCPRRPRSVPLGLEALEARAVPATTLTWTGQGGDNLWSDANNWKHTGGPDKVPGAGDNLVFPAGVSNLNSQNDIAGLSLASIGFTGAGYDISGSGVSLSGGITESPTSGRDTIEIPITVAQTQNFTARAGLTLALTGGVTCTSALTLDGGGTVELGGSSSVTGQLTVLTGTLTVEHGATLTDAGTVTLGGKVGGGSLDDHGQITVAAAGSLSLHGALTVETDGTLTDAGNVSVGLKGSLDDRGDVSVLDTGTLDDATAVTVESGATLTDAGALTVEHGAVLTDAGSVTVTKTSPTDPRATIDDHGQIMVGAGPNGPGGGSMLLRGATLTVESDGTLTDAGNVSVGLKGSLDDRGGVSVQATGTLDDATVVTVESGATLTDAGALTVEHGAVLTDAGSVTVGVGATADDHGQVTVAAAGANGQAAGAVDVQGALTVESDGTLTDAGGLAVEHGGTLDDGGATTVGAGANFTSHGTLQVEAGHTLDVSGNAVLAGTSQQPAILAATLTNATAPVISLHPGATLALDTMGTGTSALNLPGVPGFVPTPGQQFPLVANATGNPVQGLFDDASGKPPLNEGDVVHVGAFALTISYKSGQRGLDVVLTNVPVQTPRVENHLSVPLKVDDQIVPAGGSLSLSPSTHTLEDPNGTGTTIQFSVTQGGAVSYDQSRYGRVLSGFGTPTLDVIGRTVTIDTTVLSVPTLTLDGTLSVSNTAPFTFTDLLGRYALVDSGGAGASIQFMLDADGTVSYDAPEGVLTGAGSSVLVAHGVEVQIDARALQQNGVTTFTVVGQPPYSTREAQTIWILPGAFTIEYTTNTNLTVTLNFTVSEQDQVAFTGGNPIFLGSPPLRITGNQISLSSLLR